MWMSHGLPSKGWFMLPGNIDCGLRLVYEYGYSPAILRRAVISFAIAAIWATLKPNGMGTIHNARNGREFAVKVNSHLSPLAYSWQVILLGDVCDLVDLAMIYGEVDEGVLFHGCSNKISLRSISCRLSKFSRNV